MGKESKDLAVLAKPDKLKDICNRVYKRERGKCLKYYMGLAIGTGASTSNQTNRANKILSILSS